MRFAINLPNFGPFGDAQVLSMLAQEAEAHGWDGFFIWDHVIYTQPENYPVAEPWVSLTAIALRTSRIRFGAMVTPLPRRRPWQLARQAITLDRLAGGRLVLGAGIGGDWFGDYSTFGESPDARLHGEQLDEALEIVRGLCSAVPFQFSGKHYTIREVTFLPPPLQSPIPIWVAGVWPGKKPFHRAVRWDGVAPISRHEHYLMTPEEVRDLAAFVQRHRTSPDPFEIVLSGPVLELPQYRALREAGATWYQDSFEVGDVTVERVRDHIRQGPPHLD